MITSYEARNPRIPTIGFSEFWRVANVNLPSFVATILDRPDDDGPRLVLADWLDEIGDQRGEQFRRPGRWVLVQRWHGSWAGSFRGTDKRPVSILLWDDMTGDGPAAVIGAVTPIIVCESRLEEHPPEFVIDHDDVLDVLTADRPVIGGQVVTNHYEQAATRLAGRWMCWACATATSRARTTQHVKNLTNPQMRALVEGIVARPVDAG